MKLGGTHDTPDCYCTACGKLINGMTQLCDDDEPEVDAPNPGAALTICLGCGHIMAVNDDLTVRDLTQDELLDVAGDPRIVAFNNIRSELK